MPIFFCVQSNRVREDDQAISTLSHAVACQHRMIQMVGIYVYRYANLDFESIRQLKVSESRIVNHRFDPSTHRYTARVARDGVDPCG